MKERNLLKEGGTSFKDTKKKVILLKVPLNSINPTILSYMAEAINLALCVMKEPSFKSL